MSYSHSITSWLARLKQGEEQATAALWERFFDQLRRIARRKLGNVPRRSRDEEDLALSAMNALFVGAREGRFHRLETRDDLWQLLIMILGRKASNQRRWQRVRRETPESDLPDGGNGGLRNSLEQAIAAASTEQGLESLGLECEELLSLLEERFRQVALLKLSGHTNLEIARLQNRSIKTIERYLMTIRLTWSEALKLEEGDGVDLNAQAME